MTFILMYKHNKGMLPNIFNDMLMKHTPSHNYNMRKKLAYTNYHIVNPTPDKNALVYVGPELWNTIIMNNHVEDCTFINIIILFKGQ